MTTNEILGKVLAIVTPWANGQAFIASGFFDCWQQLMNKPGTAKVGIYATGGQPLNNFPQASNLTRREDVGFKLVLSRGRGLNLDRAANLTQGSGGGEPLWDLLDQLKLLVMNMSFPPIAGTVPHEYLGWGEWGKDIGVNIDAFELNFRVTNQIPMATANPEGGPAA